jgi:hypothetical protein
MTTIKPVHYLGIAAAVGIGFVVAQEIRGALIAKNISDQRVAAACTPHRRKGGMEVRGVLEQVQAVPELPEVDGRIIFAVNSRLESGLAISAQYEVLKEIKRVCPARYTSDIALDSLEAEANLQLADHQARQLELDRYLQQQDRYLQQQIEWANGMLNQLRQ